MFEDAFAFSLKARMLNDIMQKKLLEIFLKACRKIRGIYALSLNKLCFRSSVCKYNLTQRNGGTVYRSEGYFINTISTLLFFCLPTEVVFVLTGIIAANAFVMIISAV